MERIFGLMGAMFGGLGVAAGAFGAHALKGRLTPDLLEIFETAVRYQMWHALALLIVSLAFARIPNPAWTWAGWGFAVGTVIFSGSLYLLAFTGHRTWGALTPVGGLLLLSGWAALAWGWVRLGGESSPLS